MSSISDFLDYIIDFRWFDGLRVDNVKDLDTNYLCVCIAAMSSIISFSFNATLL
jgi:hypothetical protein